MRGSRTDARRRRHLRVRKKIRGVGSRPRLAVYRSNRYVYAQVIDDGRGHTVAAASSQERELRDRPSNVETAAEVGKRVGERARDAGVSEVVFDRGGFPYHGQIKALADAARESGLKF